MDSGNATDPAPPAPRTYPPVGGSQDVFHLRSAPVPLPLIERASGVRMWDNAGNEYIDVSSGPVVSNIGHGNERVAAAMAAQARTMDFAYARVARHQPNIDLARRLAELAGPGFERVCFASGGSEAMEIALKLLRQHAIVTGQPQRRKLITCEPAYHGSTIATMALASDDRLRIFLDGFGVPAERIPAPLTYRTPDNLPAATYARHCAEQLEQKILSLGPQNVLAFIMEPVGGLATGCLVPHDDYFTSIRQICRRHGVHLVFDEVLCGTGRTGRFLAAHHWPDALPDIAVVAKGLGSGYAPLGAVLAPAAMVDEIATRTGFNFMHTYAANPVCCAAGLAVLDEYERLDLMRRATERGASLRARLAALQDRVTCIGDIRGLGLLMAIEIVAARRTRQPYPPERMVIDHIRTLALRHGLIIYARQTAGGKYGDWFMVSPPLTITEDECGTLVQRLEATLLDFERETAGAG